MGLRDTLRMIRLGDFWDPDKEMFGFPSSIWAISRVRPFDKGSKRHLGNMLLLIYS